MDGERTYNKIDIAVDQLEQALSLFLSGESYASSLTLAGAAEEILGKAAEIEGIENSLRELHRKYNDPNLVWINPPKTWSEFTTKGKNVARNAVKHLSDESDLTFVCDLEDEALWMLVRAIDNYNRVGFNPTPRIKQFDDWFYENVIGI
jgi:hypothetical protein